MLFGILSKQSLLFVSLNFIIFTYTLDAFVNKSSRSFGNVVNGLSKVSWKKNVQFDNSK